MPKVKDKKDNPQEQKNKKCCRCGTEYDNTLNKCPECQAPASWKN